jgi:hypothetical protein
MPSESLSFDRRQFLQTSAAGAAAVLFASRSAFAADDPYQGMKMGLQSYTLRNFKVEEALKITKDLGLHYWEAFPGRLWATACVRAFRAPAYEWMSPVPSPARGNQRCSM